MTTTELPRYVGDARVEPFELLVEDEFWTLVPIDATDDERVTQWISVDPDCICDLSERR